MAFKSQRRFQNTGFGLDRDRSRVDNLPAWKKQMFNSIRNKTKQHRQTLLQRLEQQRNQNKNLSPNSKKKNANNTIDSFKKSLIDHHLKEFNQSNNNNNNGNMNNNQFNQNMNNNSNNNGFGMNNNNMNTAFGRNGNGNGFKFNGFGNNSMNNNVQQNGNMQNMQNGNVQRVKFQEDQDMETANLSSEQYKQIFAELSKYLEDTEISDIRSSFVEELEKDNEIDELEEIIAHEDQFNPHVVYCPVCCKNAMEIEYINNHQAVYGCLCGTKFQPRDKSVSIPAKKEKNNNMNNNMNKMFKFGVQVQDLKDNENKENNWSIESDLEHGQRMLRSLKANISNLMNYHCQQIKCKGQMNFAVINESGYLQAWCNQCNCNEIVI